MTAADRAQRALLRTALTTSTLVLAATVLVVAGGATASAAPAAPAATDGTGGARLAVSLMSSDSYETKVQHYVNRKRAAHGLRPLRFESCTDGTAERWALRLATTGGFFHQSTGTILTTCHAYYAGETLGRGGLSPRGLVKSWMRSSLHRVVLLSKRAKRIGVGSYLSGGQWVTAANFTRF